MKALSNIAAFALLMGFVTPLALSAEQVIVGDELTDQVIDNEPMQTEQPVVTSPDAEPAGIRIGGERSKPPQKARHGGLQVHVDGARSSYRVGDSISFYVSGNREFYLWAYARDERGSAVLLVPSRIQRGNKYPSGKRFRLPNPGLHFYADSAGVHDIILIASSRWLDIDSWLKRNARAQNDYWMADAAALEGAFETQGIRIGGGKRDSKRRSQNDVVVHRITFDVR